MPAAVARAEAALRHIWAGDDEVRPAAIARQAAIYACLYHSLRAME